MRASLFIALIFVIAGCTTHSVKQPVYTDTPQTIVSQTSIDTIKKAVKKHTAITPYQLNDDYMVIDTGRYTNGPMEGLYAIVKRENKTDTIDLGVEMQKVSNHVYLYQLLHAGTPDNSGEFVLETGNYILNTNNQTVKFASIVKHFDNYFSSPQAIDGKIYFWQLIDKGNNATMKVFAAQFDPSTNQTKSHYLLDDDLDTDDSGHYASPHKNKRGDSILFELNVSQTWRFTSSF
ncbi:hypothetical protein ACFGVR_18440 [Mucilaginibacter sp. AW1-3]